jgi:hypothetical protein
MFETAKPFARLTFYRIWTAGSSETTQRYIPEDDNVDAHCSMNLSLMQAALTEPNTI